MKKTIIYIAMIAIGSATITGCGSKQGVSRGDQGVSRGDHRGAKVEKDACQTMAEELEFFRAWAEAESASSQFARDRAATVARNELASSVVAGLVSTINIFNSEVGVGELTQSAQQDILTNVNELLRGSRVICSETYVKPDPKDNTKNIFTGSVCVEVSERSITDMFFGMRDNHLKAQIQREDFINRTRDERQKHEQRRREQLEREGF